MIGAVYKCEVSINLTIYTRSRKQAPMAEDLENPTEKYMKFSRNLRKAMLRNTVHGDNLKKDLKFIQGERNKLMHSWEQRKLAFVQKKYGKQPVIRWSGDDMEKRDEKEEISKDTMNSEGCRRSGKSARERSTFSLRQLSETSRHDNKDLCTVQREKKVNTSCMTKLTVKDLSRILTPSDAKDIRCRGTASPNTSSHALNHQFSNLFVTKEPTSRHSFSPACSSRSVVQQRPCYRTLSLSPSELDQARERKLKIDSPASVELRKRATTWSSGQSTTLASDQNDSASTNLYQVCGPGVYESELLEFSS